MTARRLIIRRLIRRPYACALKRAADFAAALAALVLLSPLLLLITLTLVLFQGGSPFFSQVRIGRYCRPFRILKFRTMSDDLSPDGRLLPDDQRTTLIGSFLRSSSLDELPELLNVLAGHMSFVGPRPWIPGQMAFFSPATRRRRMSVRPGVSGLAQVMGRNKITFRQRVRIDLFYQRRLSPSLDLRILFYTLLKVVRREGILQRPDALPKGFPSLSLPPKDPATRGLKGNASNSRPL